MQLQLTTSCHCSSSQPQVPPPLTSLCSRQKTTWSLCAHRAVTISNWNTIETQCGRQVLMLIVSRAHRKSQGNSTARLALNTGTVLRQMDQRREEVHYKVPFSHQPLTIHHCRHARFPSLFKMIHTIFEWKPFWLTVSRLWSTIGQSHILSKLLFVTDWPTVPQNNHLLSTSSYFSPSNQNESPFTHDWQSLFDVAQLQ